MIIIWRGITTKVEMSSKWILQFKSINLIELAKMINPRKRFSVKIGWNPVLPKIRLIIKITNNKIIFVIIKVFINFFDNLFFKEQTKIRKSENIKVFKAKLFNDIKLK